MRKSAAFAFLLALISIIPDGSDAEEHLKLESGSYSAKRPLSVLLPEGPSAAWSGSWELPDRKAHPEEHRFAAAVIFGGDVPESRSVLDAAAFFSDYREALKGENAAGGEAWLNWVSARRIRALSDSADILVLERETYDIRGGAHGSTTREYFSLDMKNRRLLGLDDVFAPGARPLLGPALTSELRRILALGPADSLRDSGFFVEELQAVDRFYLSGDGVVFVYGQYEIAPYSAGFTEVLLPEEAIRILLQPGFGLPGPRLPH